MDPVDAGRLASHHQLCLFPLSCFFCPLLSGRHTYRLRVEMRCSRYHDVFEQISMPLSWDWRTCHCSSSSVDVHIFGVAVWRDWCNAEKERTCALRRIVYEGERLLRHEIRRILIFMMNWLIIIPDKGRVVVIISVRV